jgi:hypothetical protein
LGVLCAAWPVRAGAQTSAERVATAQALYETAAALARAGRWAEACPKLEESQRLDPALGTQFHLATCYESSGRPTSAWSLFLEVAAAAKATGQTVRESTARARAAALEPRLPRITVVLSRSAASIRDLEISRDGVTLKPVVLGTAVPVDFGSHVVRASAPNKVPWQTTAHVTELGQRIVIEVPALSSAAAGDAPAATAVAAEPSSPRPAKLGAPRVAAIAIGSVGLVGIAVGSALGLTARSLWNEADAACPSHRACPIAAHDQSAKALAFAAGSTVSFAAGGGALATALVVWLASSPRSSTAVLPLAGPGIAGLVAAGRF